jgi:hypothetical protein
MRISGSTTIMSKIVLHYLEFYHSKAAHRIYPVDDKFNFVDNRSQERNIEQQTGDAWTREGKAAGTSKIADLVARSVLL